MADEETAPAPTDQELADAARLEEEAQAAQVQAIADGLSRIDRVIDDSGFAFTALDVVDKALTTLDPIRNYPHLQFVNVAKNQLVDASPLSDLPYLVAVNLAENALVAPPAFANAYLQAVDVSQNQISTLQGFTSNTLTSLKVNDNQLETLAGVAGLPSLTHLEAARNAVADISTLSSEPSKIEALDLSENKLMTLAGIDALASLTSLSVRQNNLDTMEAIDKLAALESLTDLDLSLNPVADTENYRLLLLLQVPQLKKLDGEFVTDDERVAAVDFKQQRDAAATAEAEGDSGV